jgi:hypothetical protein
MAVLTSGELAMERAIALGRGVGDRALDRDTDELAGTFTIAHDHVREFQ